MIAAFTQLHIDVIKVELLDAVGSTQGGQHCQVLTVDASIVALLLICQANFNHGFLEWWD